MQSYGDSDWKMMFVEGTLWTFFLSLFLSNVVIVSFFFFSFFEHLKASMFQNEMQTGMHEL